MIKKIGVFKILKTGMIQWVVQVQSQEEGILEVFRLNRQDPGAFLILEYYIGTYGSE